MKFVIQNHVFTVKSETTGTIISVYFSMFGADPNYYYYFFNLSLSFFKFTDQKI